jgi:hypothetical protein
MYERFKAKYDNRPPDEVVRMELDETTGKKSTKRKSKLKLVVNIYRVPEEEFDIDFLLDMIDEVNRAKEVS